jgi:hypothetical protein
MKERLRTAAREHLTNRARIEVVATKFINSLENFYPRLDNLRVLYAPHRADFDRAMLAKRLKVQARIVQTVVKKGSITGANKRAGLADDSGRVLSTKTEQVTDSVVTTPRCKNLFDRDIQGNKSAHSVQVEVSSVKVYVNRGTITFVKLRTEVSKHTPKITQGVRNLGKRDRLFKYILCVVFAAKRAVMNVHPLYRYARVTNHRAVVFLVVELFFFREAITLYFYL